MSQLSSSIRAARGAAPVGLKGPGILLADDDEETRRVLCEILKAEGLNNVVEAADGTSCVNTMQQNPDGFRVLVLDVMMPGLSGAHILDKLVALDPPQLAVIMISGHADSLSVLEQKYALGNAPFSIESLAKPFDASELTTRIRRILMKTGGPSALQGLVAPQKPGAPVDPAKKPAAGKVIGATNTTIIQPSKDSIIPRGKGPATPSAVTVNAKPGTAVPATPQAPAAEHAAPSQVVVDRLQKQLASVEGQLAGLNTAVSELRKIFAELSRQQP